MRKWFLLMVFACFYLHSWADDEPRQSKKRVFEIKIGVKKVYKEKLIIGGKEDTLVFDKNIEDTLIYADDEKNGKSSSFGKKKDGSEFTVLNKRDTKALLNSVIYPNPSTGDSWVQVDNAENVASIITVINFEGRVIKSETFTGEVYALQNLAAGAYIVTIQNGSQVVQKRLFVK